jgi:biotin operon repressor
MNDVRDQEIEIEEYKQLKTTDIAANLNIAESTVRKYAQTLEKQGYQFRKDPTLGRLYSNIDELAINELIKLRKDGKVGLDMAAEIVATRRNQQNTNVSPTRNVQPTQSNDIAMQDINELMHDIRYIKENHMTKEQMNYFMDSVAKMMDTNTDLLRRLDKAEKAREKADAENIIFKEKLDIAIDYINRSEDERTKEKGKGFLGRLFGK